MTLRADVPKGTHPAIFRGPTGPATKPISLEKMLRPYRREAMAGINYAWGHGYRHALPVDDAGQMINPLPEHQRPEPRELPKDSPLVSKNGIRLPLRALSYRELNRRFWSKGEVVYADRLERSEPKELLAHEKTPDEMTLDELIATQDREPLSESRRSWLERGAGVLSLEGVKFDQGSIGETLSLKGQLGALGTLDAPKGSAHFADEASSIGKGVPYTLVDPITAKQIDWEQEQHGWGPLISAEITPQRTLKTSRKLLPDELTRVARSVVQTLAAKTDMTPAEQIAHAMGFDVLDGDQMRREHAEPADLIFHSSYEYPQPVVAVLSEAPCLGSYMCDTEGCWRTCPRDNCFYLECHRHERITRIAHRSTRLHGRPDELWHQRIFDVTAYELGTDGLVDPLVVQI